MNRKRSARNAYIIMTCMAIVFILPLLWVIFASFNPDAGVGLKLPSTWGIKKGLLEEAIFAVALELDLKVSMVTST